MLTVQETAEELGLTIRGVQNRLLRGVMQGERVSPRLWMIPRSEVDRWREVGKLPRGRKPRKQAEG